MAAPGGGRLWSEAWKWFNEKASLNEAQELKANIGHLPCVPEPVKEVYQGLPDVSGSVICFGCTGYVGEAVVFDSVRRGLNVTVFVREQSKDKFLGKLKDLKIQDRVTLVTGEATQQADIEKAMQATKAECCISLLASPQVTDEQNIYDVDYNASHMVVQAARKYGIKQFIYCSDTGCYQPALCTQMHKLRIEGELMRCLPDGMQYTIIRPTTYHPYVVQCIVLDEVRQGKKVPLFGAKGEAGDLAVYNPIAREDLGRFIVSSVLNPGTYGRIMPVGGPWSADNVSTLKDCTNWLIHLATPAGTTPSAITPLGMNLSDIIYKFMEALGIFSKQLKKVATIVFYYTKYWSSVSHFSPGTGVYPAHEYAQELVAAMKKDPKAFADFVAKAKQSTTGSVVYPTPLNSWWDLSQKSLSPDQMPMGAGKPQADVPQRMTALKQEKLDPARIPDALTRLRTMAPMGPICIGGLPKCDEDDSCSEHDEGDMDWVTVYGGKRD